MDPQLDTSWPAGRNTRPMGESPSSGESAYFQGGVEPGLDLGIVVSVRLTLALRCVALLLLAAVVLPLGCGDGW